MNTWFILHDYGYNWQSRCSKCFLALLVVLFLYHFVEDRRFLDTGLLQLEVLFYSINVLNIHMAIEYCKFLAMQSFVFQYRKSFICFYSLLFCKLLMYFVLGDGSNHSLLAWNEFRFSVKLFDVFVLQVIFEVLMFCFWGFEVLTAAAVVINSFFSL